MDKVPTSLPPRDDGPLILIVDDEAAIAETLADFISSLGYASFVAYNGLQALELVRKRWPALVITDLMMPLMDGARLIDVVRNEAVERNLPKPPFIVLTAASKRAVNGLVVEAVLFKPFNFDQLEEIIQRLLGQATLSQE